MKKLLVPMLVLCAALTLSTTVFAGSFEVNSDETVQIIGVYNKAGFVTNYVDLSGGSESYGSPIPAVRAYEPDGYPYTYLDPADESEDSLWDLGVANPKWPNGKFKPAFFDFTATGADWIWETEHTEDTALYDESSLLYDADASHSGRVVVFKKTFDIPNTWIPTSGELVIAADNCYEVWVNGIQVARSATCVNNWQTSYMTQPYVDQAHWQLPGIYDVGDLLKQGENTIIIQAGNEYHGWVLKAPDKSIPCDTSVPSSKRVKDVNNSPIPSLKTSTTYYQYNPGAMIFSLYVEYEEIEYVPGIDVEKYVAGKNCTCTYKCGCNSNNICYLNWDDADEPKGPVFLIGDDVYWLYVVTNTGEVPLTDVVLFDDNGTDDPADDWEPWYLWGDAGNDDVLGIDETWFFIAKDSAIAGQYENWGYVSGLYGAVEVTDEDPAHYYGQEDFEGCTPGFWKNNAEKWCASAWKNYKPGDKFNAVLGVEIKLFKGGNPKKISSYITNPTLLQALGANGSGINLLARAAVAALLNAANPDVAYAMSEDDIIAAVQEAVDEGEDAIQELGELLDEYNNAGCPLNQRGIPLFPTNCSPSQNKSKK